MYYQNTKYRFVLPEGSPETLAGAVILACAMPRGQMLRRDMRKSSFLQHRMFDPQLYLAGLDPATARSSVCKLATWPWFGNTQVPAYDSSKHGSLRNWKATFEDALLAAWQRTVPTRTEDITTAVESAVMTQLELGCEAIILPGPLTNVAALDYQPEAQWMDAGIAVCRAKQLRLPVFATVALSDNVLRGIDPRQNRLVHTITNQVTARNELAGAYLVVEQASEEGYVCTSRETLLSLLILADDLNRGAGRQVIVNYMGSFGPVILAAGARIFASGYYLSQRRLKLADFEDKNARAYPRYMSKKLAGDIGIESDLQEAYRLLGSTVLTDTPVSLPLNNAIRNGVATRRVPEWAYVQQNITAAAAHYNWVTLELGRMLSSALPEQRPAVVRRWLRAAARDAEVLRNGGISHNQSDITHQSVWLGAFEDWLQYAAIPD
jgi:hypothetical protein